MLLRQPQEAVHWDVKATQKLLLVHKIIYTFHSCCVSVSLYKLFNFSGVDHQEITWISTLLLAIKKVPFGLANCEEPQNA